MWAVSLLRYFLHASIGTKSEMQALDRRTKVILQQYKAHEAAASVERLYPKRGDHGRGLSNLLHEWEKAVVSKVTYWLRSPDPMIRGVLRYHKHAQERNNWSVYREAVEIRHQYKLRIEKVTGKTGGLKLKRVQMEDASEDEGVAPSADEDREWAETEPLVTRATLLPPPPRKKPS